MRVEVIKGGGIVYRNTFSYILLSLESHRSERGGGAKVYIFGKVSSLGVQKFQNQSHRSYKRKAIAAEA